MSKRKKPWMRLGLIQGFQKGQILKTHYPLVRIGMDIAELS